MYLAVIMESIPYEDIKTVKKSKSYRHFKMKILQNHEGNEINEVFKNNIEEKNIKALRNFNSNFFVT